MLKVSAQPMERRQFGRRRTQMHGWIRVPGRPALPCVVHDISEGGARLEMSDTNGLPFRFRLQIDADGFETDCEIKHQTPTSIGVGFVARAAAPQGLQRQGGDDVSSWLGKKSQGRR